MRIPVVVGAEREGEASLSFAQKWLTDQRATGEQAFSPLIGRSVVTCGSLIGRAQVLAVLAPRPHLRTSGWWRSAVTWRRRSWWRSGLTWTNLGKEESRLCMIESVWIKDFDVDFQLACYPQRLFGGWAVRWECGEWCDIELGLKVKNSQPQLPPPATHGWKAWACFDQQASLLLKQSINSWSLCFAVFMWYSCCRILWHFQHQGLLTWRNCRFSRLHTAEVGVWNTQ